MTIHTVCEVTVYCSR